MTSSICAAALQQFAACAFTSWQGLPDTCTITDAQQGLNFSVDYSAGRLGQRHTPAFFHTTQLDGYINFVRAWRRAEQVVLITGEYPSLSGNLAALLKSYGEPAAKLTYFQGVIEIEAGEWAYPQRGITLFMNANAEMLAQVAVYSVTSLTDYLAHLSLQEKMREFDED